MTRRTISTITIWLGVIVAVTGAVALPIAQVNSTVSFYMVIAGLGAAAAAKALRTPGNFSRAARSARKNKRALMIGALAGTIFLQTACFGIKPPSRKTLENIQRGGQTIAQVIEANRTLPDQLFRDGTITAEVRDLMKTNIEDALPDVIAFNSAMAAVLAAEKPDLKQLLPVALRMLARVDKLNLKIPGWDVVFSGIQIGARVIANYFAITISDLRRLGLSDKRIYKVAEIPANSRGIELIEKYADVPISERRAGTIFDQTD